MAPYPDNIPVVSTFLKWKESVKSTIFLPLVRDDAAVKKEAVVAVMEEYKFSEGKLNYNKNEWNDLMRLVYADDVYGRLDRLSKEIERAQTIWNALRALKGAKDLVQLEASINMLVNKANERGLPTDMPVTSTDRALSSDIVKLLLSLQKAAAAATTSVALLNIQEGINVCEAPFKDLAFQAIEDFVTHVGERLDGTARDIGSPGIQTTTGTGIFGTSSTESDGAALTRQRGNLQKVETHMRTLWEFYRRVKNTQSLAASMVAVARKIQDAMKNTLTDTASKIMLCLVDMHMALRCGEVGELNRLYSVDLLNLLNFNGQASYQQLFELNWIPFSYNKKNLNNEKKASVSTAMTDAKNPFKQTLYGISEYAMAEKGLTANASYVQVKLEKANPPQTPTPTLNVSSSGENGSAIATWLNIAESPNVRMGYETFDFSTKEVETRNITFDPPLNTGGNSYTVAAWLTAFHIEMADSTRPAREISCRAIALEDDSGLTLEVHHDVNRDHSPFKVKVGWLAYTQNENANLYVRTFQSGIPESRRKARTADNEYWEGLEKIEDLDDTLRPDRMPLMATFINSVKTYNKVKASPDFITTSELFARWGSMSDVGYTFVAYKPPESENRCVIIP